ncbi:MAG: hypothetical protein AAF578_04605 [Pseudomonadota bacterium]
MSPMLSPGEKLLGVFAISTVCAVLLLFKIWRSTEPGLLKAGYSLIVFIPIIGPLATLWIMEMPEKRPKKEQVRGPRGDFYHRARLREAKQRLNR